MTEAEQKEMEQIRTQGVILRWMRRHLYDYHPCEANQKLILDWLNAQSLGFSEENLEKCFQDIGSKFAPIPRETPPPATPHIDTLDDVAPLPSSFPKMDTLADIERVPRERFASLMKYDANKGRDLINARIAAIKAGVPANAAEAQQRASANAPYETSPRPDGLPPAPAGLTWPSTVKGVNDMSREEFRSLYHSKVYGEAFRKRVDEIYRRAGRSR